LTFEASQVVERAMCVGSEFRVDGALTENAREAKLLVMPVDLARKFVLEERKALGGR